MAPPPPHKSRHSADSQVSDPKGRTISALMAAHALRNNGPPAKTSPTPKQVQRVSLTRHTLDKDSTSQGEMETDEPLPITGPNNPRYEVLVPETQPMEHVDMVFEHNSEGSRTPRPASPQPLSKSMHASAAAGLPPKPNTTVSTGGALKMAKELLNSAHDDGSVTLSKSQITILLTLIQAESEARRRAEHMEALWARRFESVESDVQELKAAVATKAPPKVWSSAGMKKVLAPPPPPDTNRINRARPGRVIIHAAQGTSPMTDSSSANIVEQTNKALEAISGCQIKVKGAQKLPSGNISFITKTRSESKWLLENRHLWTAKVHPNLAALPARHRVVIHGLPTTFDPLNRTDLDQLCLESDLKPEEVQSARWLSQPVDKGQLFGSIVLYLLDKQRAEAIQTTGVYFGYNHYIGKKYKKTPTQCFRCLGMGHIGKYCKSDALCAKCGGSHDTKECPEGTEVSLCTVCLKGTPPYGCVQF